MARWLLVFILASCSGMSDAQEPPAWFSESLLHLPDEVRDAAARGKRVMLYFGQDGCPYCQRLMDVNFRQAAIAARAQRQLVAIALNIWGDREITWVDGVATTEKRLAAQLKVQFTPTLLFLDERGGVALRLNGYYPPHEFEAVLDRLAGRAPAKSKAPARDTLNPQPFFMPAPYDLRRKPGGKPLAVLFETAQCAQCDELHAVAFKRQEVLEQLARFDVARLGLGSGEKLTTPEGAASDAAAWEKTLNVGYVPTMLLFDARGREVFRTEAYLRPFHIAGALEYVASGAYLREPSFQRFLQSRAERRRGRGEPVDLWN